MRPQCRQDGNQLTVRPSLGRGRARSGRPLPHVLSALFLLVFAAVPAVAVGEGSGAEEAPGIEASLSGIQAQPLTADPSVAAELPHTQLDRDEILALVGGVFETSLEGVAGPFDDLVVDEFLSNHAAVIMGDQTPELAGLVVGESAQDSKRPLLFESSIPLRRDGDVLDLGLERSAGVVETTNPLVDVEIPQELGEGIELPAAGVSLSLPGAASTRTPSILDESTALYPNIGPNTDFVIAPAPRGFETFTVLRDPAAAFGEQEFELDLPSGGEITENADGSATVSAEDEALVHISSPGAIDAAGQPVPASMRVEGDSIYLAVDPSEDTSWPVLLDPMFESYQWEGTSLTGCGEFRYLGGPNVESNSPFSWICGTVVTGSTTKRGLATKAVPATFHNGQYAQIAHEVPRLKQDELAGINTGSFFAGMTLSNVNIGTSGGSASPFALTGIWDTATNNWAGLPPQQAAWGYPGNGAIVSNATISMTSGNAAGAKLAVPTSLMVNEGTATSSSGRSFSVGTASFEIADIQNPEVLNPSGSTKWVNATAKEPVEITVKDYGLGAKRAKFTVPGQGTVQVDHSCSGSVASPCPTVWTAKLGTSQYNPSVMPQGEAMVKLVGEDAIGQQSATANALVLVDHSGPVTTTTGTLAEQDIVGTGLREYNLNYTAKDGDDAAAAALAPVGASGTGQGQLERPFGVAVADDGSFYVVDRINNRVVKYDEEGKFLLQFGSTGSAEGQFNDPRGIALAADGTVWVADLGNDRIQAFSPSGTFLRKIKFSDPASQPYAIAVAPNGSLWVTDIGMKRVVGFNDNPFSNIGAVYGKQSNPIDGGTDLASPVGVTVDKFNNIWVTDNGIGKVIEFDSSRKWKFQFGTGGSGNGQLKGPVGIDIAPSGNLAVMDRDNNRIQIFKPDGTYLRQFGTVGGANDQFSEGAGLGFGPDNTLLVADAGNKRVARWSHADQDPQSGTAKVEVKVDGTIVHTKAQSCTSGIANVPGKNCSIAGSWTLDADEFAGGVHKVAVTATDAVGISQTKTIDIETHGDHTAPAIALSGTMTQQASIGTTRPNYKLKAVATDPGPTEELKSGVASTVIKVDGTTVDSSSPGCPAGGCSITREWTLNSESYSVGSHTVEVKATDAVGRVSTKTLTIDIARDTTAPDVSYMGALYSAPSGWLEQKEVGYSAFASDSGYGVTSVELKIDGIVVNWFNQACAAGGCMKFFASGQMLDMAAYSGGAHPAELIVTDGAGNIRKRKWTLNVAPDGQIPPAEANDTLEAMEETVPSDREFLPVAPTSEYLEPEIIEAGDNPHFKENQTGAVEATGVPIDASFDPATEMLTIEGTEGSLELSPAIPTQDPEVFSGAAVVLPSKQVAADTVIRPEYNGAQMFTTIRAASAPEAYEWRLKLRFGQYLVQANPQQVEVKWGNGETAFLVSAEPAHDALGKELPTTLSIINATDIALNVPHRNQGYTYPVSAGKSYETGYAMVTVFIPSEGEEAEAEEEDAEELADPITFEELSELNGELASMTQYKGSGQHRDPNKPIKRRQARKLIRVKQNGKKVDPPASASNGPGSGDAAKVFGLRGGTCSKGNCDVWQIEFDEGTFARGSNWAAVNPGGDPQNWACSHHVDDWWTWNIDMDLGPDGVDKPTLVYKGEGKHLTYWCEYNVEIYPLPELFTMDQDQVIEDWVYPNGYQVTHGSGARGIQIFQN